jgi:hypothetical protein
MIWNTILGIGGKVLEGYQRTQEAKTEAKVAVLKADAEIKTAKATAAMKMAELGQTQDYDLDRLAMENMNKSWKDELVLVVFLTPMIMAFIPSLADDALRGFEVVAQMPEWYVYIIIGMVVVIYGLRGLLTKFLDKKIGK